MIHGPYFALTCTAPALWPHELRLRGLRISIARSKEQTFAQVRGENIDDSMWSITDEWPIAQIVLWRTDET